MNKTKIGFIGCGNMGQAILKGLFDKKMIKAKQVFVCEKDAGKASIIARKFKIHNVRTIIDLVEKVNVIVLAIKPQNSKDILREIAPYVDRKKLIISIMAGMQTKNIEKFLGKGISIARVMPNMAASIGQSISAVSYTKDVSKKEKKITEQIVSAIGSVYGTPEKKQDIITALSGSGPAYFFYMIEAFVEAAGKNGLPKTAALELMIKTMKGSALVLEQTKIAPEKLRKMVTSKKGTTEAALEEFEKAGLKGIIKEGITAAKKRSEELSK